MSNANFQKLHDALDPSNTLHSAMHRATTAVLDPARAKSLGGTMRDWMQAHHGQNIDTAQWSPTGGFWTPIVREVDAKTRATGVLLTGMFSAPSLREYAGCKVEWCDATTLYVTQAGGGWILYTVSN